MTPSLTVRVETDSLGSIEIDAERYWGPQTERARRLFQIGTERFPPSFIHAFGLQKRAAAEANAALGELPDGLARPIIAAAQEIADGMHDQEFPLPVWQTGSGTQTNMNANEVIASRANEMLGHPRGSRQPVHPNDHVNRGQSSNDSFPTVMHIAAARSTLDLIAALGELRAILALRAAEWAGVVKVGRTHMMDAVPMTLGQEFNAFARQAELGIARLRDALERVYPLAQGGTAVGTGLNRHPDFPRLFRERIAALTGLPLMVNDNPFEGMGAHDAMVELSGVLNVIAVSLNKLGNDVRLLGSGPRCGIGELIVPEDGLASSIMPGKTNPTQSEVLTMVCAQVMGNHVAVTIAGSQSFLQLNVFKPVIIHNVLQSCRLLRDAARSFGQNMVEKLQPDLGRIAAYVENAPMLVAALAPHIGYDKAVAIGRHAITHRVSLRSAAAELGLVTERDFDRWVDPASMAQPGAFLAPRSSSPPRE